VSVGKDSISHESIADEKTTPTTHPLSFTFQTAAAIRMPLPAPLAASLSL
jgi:hypothetical protein